jgi:hypothetical protein
MSPGTPGQAAKASELWCPEPTAAISIRFANCARPYRQSPASPAIGWTGKAVHAGDESRNSPSPGGETDAVPSAGKPGGESSVRSTVRGTSRLVSALDSEQEQPEQVHPEAIHEMPVKSNDIHCCLRLP